jgi:uroporphyrinogen decarboxylase
MRAFAHEEPDRVPCWCGASPDFLENSEAILGLDEEGFRRRIGDDFRRLTAPWRDPGPALAEGSTWRSPFGVERHGIGYGQPLSHPLAGLGIAAFRDWPWPDAADVDVSGLRAPAKAWGGEYAILGGDWSPFWHDAIDLLGMENLLLAMYDAPELLDALMARLLDYYAGSSRRIFDAADGAIDVFFIGNDFGAQTGPLIGTAAFARFLLPHLGRLVGLGRD